MGGGAWGDTLKVQKLNQTLSVELDNIDRMLIQIELTVIAGDHESYRISEI